MSLLAALAASAVLVQPAPEKQPMPAKPAAPAPVASGTSIFQVAKTFDVDGDGAWDYLAIDSAAKRLYVPRSTYVMVLDSESGAKVGQIDDTQGVHGVALATDLGKGFTSNGRAGSVTVFDLKTWKPLKVVTVGQNPDSIVYEPTTKRVFAFNGRSNDATVINAEDFSVVGTIPLGGKPEFSVVDGAGKLFVNIEDKSELLQIDPKEMKVIQRWPLAPGEEPSGLAIDIKNNRLFAVCSNQKMVVVDASSGHVLATPEIGKGTDGATFDAIGGYAISSNGDGTATIISTQNNKFEVAQTLLTAPRARTCVIDPKTRTIYLPTAEFEAPKQGERRPAMKPNTFKIVVVTPNPAH
ncbi:MAG: YncE family protein [Phycisphaerales bacterium]